VGGGKESRAEEKRIWSIVVLEGGRRNTSIIRRGRREKGGKGGVTTGIGIRHRGRGGFRIRGVEIFSEHTGRGKKAGEGSTWGKKGAAGMQTVRGGQ